MSAFKRFGPGDQVDNVLILEPTWVLSSGSSGWAGSPEGSASVSLYGGYNRKPAGVVREYVFQRTIQGTDSFGKLSRSEPITASVNFVYMTRDERSITERSATRWGYEHWKVIDGLYSYYQRRDPDYVTASYDHYCLYFNSGSSNILTVFDHHSDSPVLLSRGLPTGSYTLEAWFNPFVTSSAGHEFTIMSHARAYRLYVSGSTGKLAFAIHSGSSTTQSTVTSSVGPAAGEWHHVAVSFDHTTLTGTMYLDLQRVATFTSPSAIPNPNNYTGSLQIGAVWGGTVSSFGFMFPYFYEDPSISAIAQAGTAFQGLIGNVRVWGAARTYTEISSSHNSRLSGTAALGPPLTVDVQMREGPLTYVGASGLGSGVLDYAVLATASLAYDYGTMYSFNDRAGPGWHPNDNTRFYAKKQFAPAVMSGTGWGPNRSADVTRMLVFSVPAGMTGRRIVPNTVKLKCRAFTDPSYGLMRTLIDDGRGGLFLSGSARLTPDGRAYAAVTYANSTSSLRLQARAIGPVANGYGVTSTILGPVGSHAWVLNESDPYNMVLTVPCFEDGFTPSEDMWSLYQFMASSSVYIRPTSIVAPTDSAGSPTFTLSGGSFGNPALQSSGSYRGVEWNKVGNVFYDEGLIVVKDPALLDFAAPWTEASSDPAYLLDLSFHGESRIPVKTFMCRIDRGDLNASLNRTFWDEEEDGDRVRTHPDDDIYVSTVGLYNSDRELVGVARLAEPLRVRPRDRMNVKLRMDF